MRDGDNIREVAALGVDWIGMIFWPKSPRHVTMIPTYAGIIPDRAPAVGGKEANSPKRVGVFVDEMPQNIITRVVNFKLDIIQLHGHETPIVIRNLRKTLDPDIRPGIRIIKALTVATPDDVAAYKQYEDCVDYFLFDTKCQSVGGRGQHFDWTLLNAYDGNKPFLLSGGIGPDDAHRLKEWFNVDSNPVAAKCIGIDLNSRFETAPGLKDVHALSLFLSQFSSKKIPVNSHENE